MRRLPCVGTLWRMAEEAILVLREDLGLNRQGPALHKLLSRSVGLQLSRGRSLQDARPLDSQEPL